MLADEFFGLFLIIGALAYTNVCGLGGGGILVPILIAIFKFDTRSAVALSTSSYAVNGLTRSIFFLR